jgi:hypothetical protein
MRADSRLFQHFVGPDSPYRRFAAYGKLRMHDQASALYN